MDRTGTTVESRRITETQDILLLREHIHYGGYSIQLGRLGISTNATEAVCGL